MDFVLAVDQFGYVRFDRFSNDIIIVREIERATGFEYFSHAMGAAIPLNKDWGEYIVHVVRRFK